MQIGYDVEFSQRGPDGSLVFPTQLRSQNYEVTQDNLLNEVRSKREFWCREELIASINQFKRWLNRLRHEKGITTDFSDVIFFEDNEWNQIPRAWKRLGCAPDGCIYEEQIDHSTWQDYPMRVAGGHIHIGIYNVIYCGPGDWKTFDIHNPNDKNIPNWSDIIALKSYSNYIRNLDAVVATSNVIWNRRREKERRLQYGTAGSFRKKPYGLEYRVLDNSWILHNWSISLTIGLVKMVAEAMTDDPDLCLVKENEISELRNVINNDEYTIAKDMFMEYYKRLSEIRYSSLGLNMSEMGKLHDYLYRHPILEGATPTIRDPHYGIGEYYASIRHLV